MNFTQTLQLMLEQKDGQLVNEVLNPPAYLRRSGTGTANTVLAKATTATRGTTQGG